MKRLVVLAAACALTACSGIYGPKGNDTGGVIPWSPENESMMQMLAQGWITHPQLQKALELQRANGTGRIGDWLRMNAC